MSIRYAVKLWIAGKPGYSSIIDEDIKFISRSESFRISNMSEVPNVDSFAVCMKIEQWLTNLINKRDDRICFVLGRDVVNELYQSGYYVACRLKNYHENSTEEELRQWIKDSLDTPISRLIVFNIPA